MRQVQAPKPRHFLRPIPLIALVGLAGACQRDGTGLGLDEADPEFVVNVHSTGDQMAPVVVARPEGGFLLVWESGCLSNCAGPDGSEFGIFARRYGASGLPLAGEYQVNETTDFNQREADADLLPDGRFAVVWSTEAPVVDDAWDISLRLYNADGFPSGHEIVVNEVATDTQWRPQVALGDDGVSLVIWEHHGAGGSRIRRRLFDADGAPLGDSRGISSPEDSADFPALASLPDGRAVAVWSGGGWGGIVAQRLTDGAPSGPPVEVAEEAWPSSYPMPDVAILPDGGFVVTWLTGADYDVAARVFDADGDATTDELAVNRQLGGLQMNPAVTASLGGERFVISWDTDLQDGSYKEILAAVYLVNGEEQTTDFVVNHYKAYMQDNPSLAATTEGWLVAWQSSPESGSGYNVYLKIFPSWE